MASQHDGTLFVCASTMSTPVKAPAPKKLFIGRLTPLIVPASCPDLSFNGDSIFSGDCELSVSREGVVSCDIQRCSSLDSSCSRIVRGDDCVLRSSPLASVGSVVPDCDATIEAHNAVESESRRRASSGNGLECTFTLDDLAVDGLPIGRGSSGVVHRATHRDTGQVYALKRIYYDPKAEKQLVTELVTNFKCEHRNVVRHLGSFFNGSDRITIAMEYMDGGTLADVLKCYRGSPLSERCTAVMARQLLEGLNYLQSLKIIHRDIKPSNILVNSHGELKISDFGVSKMLEANVIDAETCVGTSLYMSPERFQGEGYSFESDIWAAGLTILECATGQAPFHAGKPRTFFDMMMQVVEQNPPALSPDSCSPELCDFVAQFLTKDPKKRPCAAQLLTHPFILKHTASAAWRGQAASLEEMDAELLQDVAVAVHRMQAHSGCGSVSTSGLASERPACLESEVRKRLFTHPSDSPCCLGDATNGWPSKASNAEATKRCPGLSMFRRPSKDGGAFASNGALGVLRRPLSFKGIVLDGTESPLQARLAARSRLKTRVGKRPRCMFEEDGNGTDASCDEADTPVHHVLAAELDQRGWPPQKRLSQSSLSCVSNCL